MLRNSDKSLSGYVSNQFNRFHGIVSDNHFDNLWTVFLINIKDKYFYRSRFLDEET